MNEKILSLDLKIDRESLVRTGCVSEFHTDGAENLNARMEGFRSSIALLFSPYPNM